MDGAINSGRSNRALRLAEPPLPTDVGAGTVDISILDHDMLHSPAFIAEWDDLAGDVGEPNPFFESWYLLPSLELCAGDARIDVIAMRRSGRLIGLVPTCRSWDYYGKPIPHLAMWVHPNIFNGTPLVRHGEERAFWEQFLTWSDANCGLAFSLHLSQLPLGTALSDALFAACADSGRPIGIVESYGRAFLCSAKGSDRYKADHHSGNILEPLGLAACVRVGFCHYNSRDEVARLLSVMAEITA